MGIVAWIGTTFMNPEVSLSDSEHPSPGAEELHLDSEDNFHNSEEPHLDSEDRSPHSEDPFPHLGPDLSTQRYLLARSGNSLCV